MMYHNENEKEINIDLSEQEISKIMVGTLSLKLKDGRMLNIRFESEYY